MNLVVNGRDAMPNGGTLTIETSDVHVGTAREGRTSGIVPGDYVMLAVSDTGVGMDATTVARIFEPFFTTKPPGQGLGLGLDNAMRIVRKHRGHLSVRSEPRDTCFRVRLPLDPLQAY
jgi:signal transduction histidine kinase